MEKQDLEQLLELEKKFYLKLIQTFEITKELDEAVQRQDRQAVQLLLSSRQMPVLELQEVDSYIYLKRVDLDAQDASCFDRLVAGEPAQQEEEAPVVEQVGINRRLLERLQQLDKSVNRKLCAQRSHYGPSEGALDSVSRGAG